MRQLGFALAALSFSVAALLVSCGPSSNNTATLGHRPGTGGGGGNQESSLKALPELASDDVKLRALEELMRTFRTAGFLASMPAKPDSVAGCLSFKHFATGIPLKVYYNCGWDQAYGGQALHWGMKSEEIFNYASAASGSSTAIAQLALSVTRTAVAPGAPLATYLADYHRLTTLAPGSGERSLTSSATVGTLGDASSDYWDISIQGKLETMTAPMQLALSSLVFTYRPADTAAKHTYTKMLKLVPKTITTFDGTSVCRRPLGTFDWSISVGGDVTEMGTMTVDQSGITETTATPPKTVAWPTSCLEFTAPGPALESSTQE